MSFFYRHRTFSIIAAVLLVLLILLLASAALQGKDNAVGKVARTIVTAFQKPFSALATGIGDAFGGAFSDDALMSENKELKNKLSEVQKELTIARLDRDEFEALQGLQDIFGSSIDLAEKVVKSANVVSLDGSSITNVFSIDIGSDSGVMRNTVVLSGDGLIGRVVSVSNNSAKVVSILNESNNVGFQITRNDVNYLGSCSGDGKGNIIGHLLDEEATVEVGDTVSTSGIGGIYPSGILIGTVVEAELQEDSPLLYVKIEPKVYFKGLKKVAVLI